MPLARPRWRRCQQLNGWRHRYRPAPNHPEQPREAIPATPAARSTATARPGSHRELEAKRGPVRFRSPVGSSPRATLPGVTLAPRRAQAKRESPGSTGARQRGTSAPTAGRRSLAREVESSSPVAERWAAARPDPRAAPRRVGSPSWGLGLQVGRSQPHHPCPTDDAELYPPRNPLRSTRLDPSRGGCGYRSIRC